MGHIATSWSALQIPDGQTTDTSKARYMWAASIVEVSLRWMIDLWDTQNKDVQQNSRLKVKHQETFRTMLSKKIQMQPCDHWLFPNNPALFISIGHSKPTWHVDRISLLCHPSQHQRSTKRLHQLYAKYSHVFSTHSS